MGLILQKLNIHQLKEMTTFSHKYIEKSLFATLFGNLVSVALMAKVTAANLHIPV